MQQMETVVDKDNGKGGTTPENNREYGGLIFKGKVIEGKPGPVTDPSAGINASISSYMNIDFHSHPSGTKRVNLPGGRKGTAQFTQAASKRDITIATGVDYVYGMQDPTIYIYDKTGVVATLPKSTF